MSGSGREALSNVRDWSGVPPGCPGVVERPSGMSENGRETLPDIREALSDVLVWSGSSSSCPEVVGMPSLIFGSVRKALPDVREWSRGPPGCSGVVGRISEISKSGR